MCSPYGASLVLQKRMRRMTSTVTDGPEIGGCGISLFIRVGDGSVRSTGERLGRILAVNRGLTHEKDGMREVVRQSSSRYEDKEDRCESRSHVVARPHGRS